MHQRLVLILVASLVGSCASSSPGALQSTTVALDPGHGGAFSGAAGPSGTLEKDVNLHVALALEEILRSWGVRVVMTREGDASLYPEIGEDIAARRRLASVAGADLLLSIHANFSPDPGVRGFEVWVPRAAAGAYDGQNRNLAARIRSELAGVWGGRDLGTRDDHDLAIFRETYCAAALVELEFLSNPDAEKELARPSVHRQVARALAEAIRDWALARGGR